MEAQVVLLSNGGERNGEYADTLAIIMDPSETEKLCESDISHEPTDSSIKKPIIPSSLPPNQYASDPNIARRDNGYRAKLRRAMITHRFQVFVVSFVIIDCMIVIAELLMDLRILSMEDTHTSLSRGSLSPTSFPVEAYYLVPDVLHSISIAILSMFILESCVKMFAFGLAFLRLGWEIFDTVVVTVTFILDVVMQHSHSSANGLGLFIILRLWRVARILNGMVRSVKSQADRHVECEKRRRENLQEELKKYRDICQRQREIIIQLEEILKSNNIPSPLFKS